MLPVGFEPTILVYLRICFFHIRTMLYQTKPWKRMFLLCGSNTHPSVIIKTSFLSDVPPQTKIRGVIWTYQIIQDRNIPIMLRRKKIVLPRFERGLQELSIQCLHHLDNKTI